jgi:hypothetical protein
VYLESFKHSERQEDQSKHNERKPPVEFDAPPSFQANLTETGRGPDSGIGKLSELVRNPTWIAVSDEATRIAGPSTNQAWVNQDDE